MYLQSFDVSGDFVGQNRHNGQGQGKGWDKVNNITTWSNSHQGKIKRETFLEYFPTDFW